MMIQCQSSFGLLLPVLVILFSRITLNDCKKDCRQACSAVSMKENTTHYPFLASCMTDEAVEPNVCCSTTVTYAEFQMQDSTGWFLCHDSSTNQTKIGLELSFLVNHTSTSNNSSETINRYQIAIKRIGTINNHVISCSMIDVPSFQHVKSIVTYRYIGLHENIRITPGDKFQFIVESEPTQLVRSNKEGFNFDVSLPFCENNGLTKTPQCQYGGSLYMNCSNKTFDIFYHIPHKRLYASANIFVYHSGDSDNVEIMNFTNQPLSGIIQSVPFPKHYDQLNYSLEFWASKEDGGWILRRKHLTISFESCVIPDSLPPFLSLPIPIIILVTLVFCVVAIVITKLFRKYDWYILQRFSSLWKKEKQVKPITGTSTEFIKMVPTLSSHESEVNKHICKRRLKIYLIFVDDHPKHRDVVLNFACFLQHDLSFDVIFELYQFQEICNDPTSWMLKSLSESDKLIVIWSPGATKRWNCYKNGNNESVENDMFSPILQNIERDLFHKRNLGKYFFAYFDYCTKDDIPQDETFCDSSVHHFKLMLEFEKLYFHLNDEEKYLPGIVNKEVKASCDHYYDPNLTKYGLGLKTSISKMCAVVKSKGWFVPKSVVSISYINLTVVDSSCNVKKNIIDVKSPTPVKQVIGSLNKKDPADDSDIISTNSLEISSDFFSTSDIDFGEAFTNE